MSNQRRFALIGRGFGSDEFNQAVSDQIGSILVDSSEINFTYDGSVPSITAALINASITFARLQNADALSVLGRASNSSGVMDEIAAGTDHQVLRRSGTAVGFGAVNLAQSAAITGDLPFANLTQGAALSVLGVTGNATADVASIAAGSDHQVLRRSGTALTFGAVNLAQSAAVTGDLPFSNIAQITGQAVLGVATSGAGDLAAISAGTNDRVLRQTGDSLNFGQLTAGMFPNAVVPDAALSSNVARLSVSNTFTASGGGSAAAIIASSAVPAFTHIEAGAAADEGVWDTLVVSSQLRFRTVNDANNAAVNWLTVDRTGTAIDAINLNGNTILNGNTQRVTGTTLARWIMDTTSGAGTDQAYHLFSIGGATKAFYGVGPLFGSSTVNDLSIQVQSGSLVISVDGGTSTNHVFGAAATLGAASTTPTHQLNTSTATGATGGADTLPANPVGFVVININGTSRKIPYYAT